MLFKELKEGECYTVDGEECPFKGDFCAGGVSSNHRGEPVEPMCVAFEFTDDTDLDKEYAETVCRNARYEEQIDRRLKLEQQKKEKNSLIRQKRLQYRIRNMGELLQISKLKKDRKKIAGLQDMLSSYVEAVGWANEFFGYSKPADDVLVSQATLAYQNRLKEITTRIERIDAKICELKEQVKENEKNFKKKEKEKNEIG